MERRAARFSEELPERNKGGPSGGSGSSARDYLPPRKRGRGRGLAGLRDLVLASAARDGLDMRQEARGELPTLPEAEGRGKRIVVSLRREKTSFSKDARASLAGLEVDPVKILAMIAAGDVVGLGLLTAEEYEQRPVLDADTGRVLEPGGKDIAAELVPLQERRQSARDLLPFLYSKPQDPTPKTMDDQNRAMIYLPENGRTSSAADAGVPEGGAS